MIITCEYCNRDIEFSKEDMLAVKNGKQIHILCKCSALIRVYRGNEKSSYLCITQEQAEPEQKTYFAGLKVSITYLLNFLWLASSVTVVSQPFYDHIIDPIWLNTSLIFFIIMTYVRFYR